VPSPEEPAALPTHAQTISLGLIEHGLDKIGYGEAVRERQYRFADYLSGVPTPRTVDLAAFAREPHSYDTACISVACADGQRGPELVVTLRALGAPMLFEVNAAGDLVRWKVTGTGEPARLESIPQSNIRQAFWQHRTEWKPETILRAKSIPTEAAARQLDFFDAGLMPAIGEAVSHKLGALLEDALSNARQCHDKEQKGGPFDYDGLFRLVFRLLAAKVMGDRGHPGDWLADDAAAAIRNVEAFYFQARPAPPAMDDREVQDVIWGRIRNAFHFQNLSVDALAYVYENTLVSPETRDRYGTHSTLPQIAEFLVQHLPFQDTHWDELRVLEPCAGHGVFLVAAMRRMRDLLPLNMTARKRHDHFVERLVGIEVDPFACEVARLSLMLADYPNPDGWRIIQEDVFAGPSLSRELRQAAVVLCNPPFEDFSREERRAYGSTVQLVQKPAELLRRILHPNPPPMLGLVLPRSFISGRAYRDFNARLGKMYTHAQLMALPDGVFTHSDAETVLVMCHGRRPEQTPRCAVHSSVVLKPDRDQFLACSVPSMSRDDVWRGGKPSLWTSPLQDVWDRLSHLNTLGQVAEIHRGIEFSIPLDDETRPKLISEKRQPGFVPGLEKVPGRLDEAFVHHGHAWLNVSPEVMRGNAHKLPWQAPKVVVNAARVSRGPWRLLAVPDSKGLVCYQRLHGIWPSGGWSILALAGALNGPVANAYLLDRDAQRDHRIVTLKSLPLPALTTDQHERLSALAGRYCETRRQLAVAFPNASLERALSALLREIDALVLRGYDLPPRLERRVLDCFAGHERPVPFPFRGFFPTGFRPCIPYHEYVSPDWERARADETLKRLKTIRDQAIHEALVHLEELDADDQ